MLAPSPVYPHPHLPVPSYFPPLPEIECVLFVYSSRTALGDLTRLVPISVFSPPELNYMYNRGILSNREDLGWCDLQIVRSVLFKVFPDLGEEWPQYSNEQLRGKRIVMVFRYNCDDL